MKTRIRFVSLVLVVLMLCSTMFVACDLHVHEFGDWVVIKDATCTESGLKTRSCTICNEEEEEPILPQHTYGDWVILKDSTCTENGWKVRKCTACKEEEGEYVLPQHTWMEIEGSHRKRCVLCEEISEEMSEHIYIDGICSICHDYDIGQFGYDGSAVTITFYHTMGENLRTVLDQYIPEFNKLYPNITVIHKQVGGYDDVRDRISAEITVGSQPNIAYCYPDHVALYNLAKAVQPLDELIDSTITVTHADGTTEVLGLTAEQKADIIEGFYNEGREYGDDLMYTMPFSKSTEVLYYNKTFFEQHNISVPTTWEEMGAVCAKIKEIDPTSYPLGYDSESNWFITMCEQYGSPYTSATGDHYLFDNDTNKAFVKTFRDWYQKGYLTTQTLYGAYTSGLFVNQDPTKPVSYMSIGSSAGAKHQRPAPVDGVYPFEVGIASIPQVNPAAPKVISQGPSVCVFKKDNPQEVIASWLFIKFLTTSVEFQAEFAMASGYVPVLKSVAQNEKYASFLATADGGANIAALSAQVCLAQQSAYYTSPAFNGSSTARRQVGDLLCKCFTEPDGGNLDAMIKKAFEDAIDECEYSN